MGPHLTTVKKKKKKQNERKHVPQSLSCPAAHTSTMVRASHGALVNKLGRGGSVQMAAAPVRFQTHSVTFFHLQKRRCTAQCC